MYVVRVLQGKGKAADAIRSNRLLYHIYVTIKVTLQENSHTSKLFKGNGLIPG